MTDEVAENARCSNQHAIFFVLIKKYDMKIVDSVSKRLLHFWHVVSNVRPIFWITLYIALVPVFALFYWLLPDGQFRIPDGGTTDYGGWLYYSIVTITTLGFGDYTPQGAGAQCITAVEVMCGLIVIGFFLNAVGSMKSEIDVESELEKQKMLHEAQEKEKLTKNVPIFLHKLNVFLSYCYAVTTPKDKREKSKIYNENFSEEDLKDMGAPAGIPEDNSSRSAVEGLLAASSSLSLYLDTLQSRIDMTQWPDLLEDCFGFVANYQMLSHMAPKETPHTELSLYIRRNAALARDMETLLTKVSAS